MEPTEPNEPTEPYDIAKGAALFRDVILAMTAHFEYETIRPETIEVVHQLGADRITPQAMAAATLLGENSRVVYLRGVLSEMDRPGSAEEEYQSVLRDYGKSVEPT